MRCLENDNAKHVNQLKIEDSIHNVALEPI